MPITQNNVRQAEFQRNIFVATPEPGTKVCELLKSEYWVHVAKTLHISDRIEVMPEDGEYFAELIVTDVTQHRVTLVLLRLVPLEVDAPAAPVVREYEVTYRGPIAQHSVRKISDKSILKEGLGSKAEAVKWLQEYEAGLVK